jgi:homoserine dehydrogenase
MPSNDSLRVAVLGAGTVGGPVVRAFLERPEKLAPFDGVRLTLAGVADKFMDRVIARGVPAAIVTDAPAHLVADPDVDVIVELMGGDEPARTLIAAALAAGKSVVTANKHVVAHHGPEFEAIAREHGGIFRFEAAVGGGTPVLSPLAADLAANEIHQVRGIVNGTTNFILTSMRENGSAYADVLAEAQARGYAEADPRGDVEGDDAVNKVVILARLAFGAWLAPADVLTTPPTLRGAGRPGITGVTADEVTAAGALGLTLKLIALAEIGADGRPTASVLPSMVARDSPLGRTDWVLNRIEVVADPVGTVAFSGPGAGGDATSSAVLGDLIALARGHGSTWAGLAHATAVPPLAPEASGEAAARATGSAGPLAGARAWFAFLPGVAADAVRATAAAADAAAADAAAADAIDAAKDVAGRHAIDAAKDVAGGTAVRTNAITLAAARAALAPASDASDATLYPVVD